MNSPVSVRVRVRVSVRVRIRVFRFVRVWAHSIAGAETIDFLDPHFHVWDVRDEGVWDGEILFKPDGKEVFDIHGYESIMRSNTPGTD